MIASEECRDICKCVRELKVTLRVVRQEPVRLLCLIKVLETRLWRYNSYFYYLFRSHERQNDYYLVYLLGAVSKD